MHTNGRLLNHETHEGIGRPNVIGVNFRHSRVRAIRLIQRLLQFHIVPRRDSIPRRRFSADTQELQQREANCRNIITPAQLLVTMQQNTDAVYRPRKWKNV